MKKECDLIRAIIDTWELEGSVSAEDYEAAATHLQSCGACSERYRLLLPLLRRDAALGTAASAGAAAPAGTAASAGNETPAGADFTDSVMARIAEETAGVRSRRTTPGFGRGTGMQRSGTGADTIGPGKGGFFRYVAAAAALLIIGGLVLRFAVLPLTERGPEGAGPGGAVAAGREEVPAESTEQPGGAYVEVHFTLTAPEAEQVALVGDFTDWETAKLVLEDDNGDGVWEAQIKLEKGKVYAYNFIIDGEEWIPDPNALMQVDDGFGGESSLLTL